MEAVDRPGCAREAEAIDQPQRHHHGVQVVKAVRAQPDHGQREVQLCGGEANHRVGCATRDMFLGWFPRPLRPLVRPAIYAMMDDAMIAGFGFPRPSRLMRRLVPGRRASHA